MLTDTTSPPHVGHASPSTHVEATRIDSESVARVEETLAEETPVTLAYNLLPYAVMMATPADLEDFAVGFSLTEGVVADAAQILHVDIVRYSQAIEIQLDVPAATAAAVSGARSRRLSGRTGCGICGTAEVERVLRELPAVPSGAAIESGAVVRAMRELASRQPLNDDTGAVHAAGWARADGSLVHVREDVGRHNALDKLIGALVRAGERAEEGFVVMTSRGSFELVQKAAILGVPVLATVSAPTALAVRVAEGVGLALVGFAREERLTVYSHEARLRR
ncbi:MAG: formate dehydrogenase accessory sulfurtransferase FdhD [Gemmatimonadaceae bacterium]